MESKVLQIERPNIFQYHDMIEFLNDLYIWKKKNEKFFSLRQATKNTHRCSPTLVSLVLQRKRVLSPDRATDFAKVFSLSEREKTFFKKSLQCSTETGETPQKLFSSLSDPSSAYKNEQQSPPPSNHILSHWLHMYVKDAARLRGFLPIPEVVHRLLQGIASVRDISRSLGFLIREGYLRYTLDGKLVEQDVVNNTTDEIPSEKIRAVHKKALSIAAHGIDTVPMEAREARTFLLPLNQEHFQLLKSRIKEWAEEVATMAEIYPKDDEKLYQLVIHLTPVGGLELTPQKAKIDK